MDSNDPQEPPIGRRPGAVPAGVGGYSREDEPLDPDAAARGFRRLTRSREDRILAGVSGGLGRYFAVDPIFFRLGFALLVFAGGAGIFAYLAAWLFVPAEGGRTPLAGGNARQVLGRATLALVLAGLALIAAMTVFVAAAFGGGGWLAGLVLVAGLAMIVAGLTGRPRVARWVGAGALVVAIPLAVVAAAGIDAEGGIGDREYRPATVADVRDRYELGMGELVVDLRDVELPAGRTGLEIEMGVGEAVVLVAEDVCVSSRVQVGVGGVTVLGRDSSGVDVDVEWLSEDPGSGRPRLMLDADIGAGALEVHSGDAADRRRTSGWDRDEWSDEGQLVDADGCASGS